MGKISRDGVITPQPTDSEDTSPADILSEHPQIEDPQYNAIPLNEFRDEDLIDRLKGFISGSPITVTWYHQISSNATTSSLPTTPSFLSDSVNTSFLKIHGMEIRLESAMSYDFDEETTQSELSGVALVYPGITPKRGDVFLYHISPGKIGLFKVAENPKRFSMHNSTAHTVTFTLFKMLTTEDYTALTERTREERYFDKKRFLNEDGALLTKQELLDIRYLKDAVEDLQQIFHRRYYNVGYSTFMLEGKAYDPYVVNFFRKVVGSYSKGSYINMPSCYGLLDNWDRSLFATLLGENPGLEVLLTCKTEEVQYSQYSSLITMLHGRMLTTLDPDGEEAYVSESIFSMGLQTQDDFDKLVTLYIDQGVLNTYLLKSEIENIAALDMEHGFYHIPILIYFAKLVTMALHSGQAVKMVNKTISPYIHIPFTNVDVDEGFITITTLLNKVLAVVDEEGLIINISDSLISYDAATVTVDLVSIMAVKEITEIPGTWHLVASNHLLLDDPDED